MDTHAQICIPTIHTESSVRNQVCTGFWPVYTWFNNTVHETELHGDVTQKPFGGILPPFSKFRGLLPPFHCHYNSNITAVISITEAKQ